MIDILRRRRSIRVFKQQSITSEDLTQLTEALLRSPSSRGRNPWEFIFIQDRRLIRELSHAKKHGSSFLENTPLAIVILGDDKRSDVWIEDCSIAAIIVQLCAESLGIGSCWVQIRNRPHDDATTSETYVRNLLAIPIHLRVGMIIGLGYPDERKLPISANQLPKGKIYTNKYTSAGKERQ
jgi:nitroreductase